MTWKDAYGNALKLGDIVMRDSADIDARYIGKIIYDKDFGGFKIRMWSRFDRNVMNFVPVQYVAIDSAYEYRLVPRKSKLYYLLHKHCIPDIVLLANAQPTKKLSNVKFA